MPLAESAIAGIVIASLGGSAFLGRIWVWFKQTAVRHIGRATRTFYNAKDKAITNIVKILQTQTYNNTISRAIDATGASYDLPLPNQTHWFIINDIPTAISVAGDYYRQTVDGFCISTDTIRQREQITASLRSGMLRLRKP